MAEAAKTKETKPAEIAPSEKPKKRFDIVGVVMLFLVVVNTAAVAGLGIFLKKMWAEVRYVHTLAGKLQPAVANYEAEQKTLKEMSPVKLQPHQLGILYALEGFLINLSSDDGPKYLQTQIELELGDSSVEEEISRKQAVLRDTVIMLLSSRSYESLRKPEGMQKLRVDLLKAMNSVLATGQIKELYFTRFHFN